MPIPNQRIAGLACRCYNFEIFLVSQCGYYAETGWDEELGEPIYTWVPPEHYWLLVCAFNYYCDGAVILDTFWTGRKPFDPASPAGPGGTYAYDPAGAFDFGGNPLPASPLFSGPASITLVENWTP